MTKNSGKTVGIDEVVGQEKRIIEKRRKRIYPDQENFESVEENLIGVALSGGGIRSAVTNLGVLYEMSRVGLFRSVDYLSTVSGGGYIGCCVSSMLSLKKTEYKPQTPNPSETNADENIYSYSSRGYQPSLFSTSWRSFPFRDLPITQVEEDCRQLDQENGQETTVDRPMCRNFTSKDQIFHLRDRASFLLPRSILFGANVMRAVGAVTTSTLMSLVWFFSWISFAAALYMFITFSQWNTLDQDLEQYPVVQYEQSGVTEVEGTAVVYKDQESQADGFFKNIAGTAGEAFTEIRRQLAGQFSAFWQLGYFFPIGILGFVWGLCASSYMKWVRVQYSKHSFESEDLENYIGRKQLKHVSLLTVFFLLLVLFCSFLLGTHDNGDVDPRLLYPLFFCLCSLAGSIAVFCYVTFRNGTWNRRSRAELAISSGIFLYAIVGSYLFAILPAFILIGNKNFLAIVLAVLALILRYYFKDGSSLNSSVQGKGFSVMLTKISRWFMGMLVPIFILLAIVGIGTLFRDQLFTSGQTVNISIIPGVTRIFLFALAVVSGAFGIYLSTLNYNRISPHVFYKDRLAEAFLATFMRTSAAESTHCTQHSRMELARNSVEMDLVDLHGNSAASKQQGAQECAARGPYLLINSTLNLTAVRDLNGFRRQSTNFLFSRCFTGSDRTGYIATDAYDPPLKLGRAMTISGAAITSVRGAGGTMAESFVCTILGVRLGYWLRNPIAMNPGKEPGMWSWRNLFYELFRYTNSRHSHVYLSDGGHCGDNLAILPLLQRKVKLIIASDAECDPDHSFNSLNNSIRRAYVDHNIKISISLDDLLPKQGYTTRHFTIGRIFYPDRPWLKSWILVIKNTITGEESTPILNYKKKSDSFPHESTADQFFSEEQFEVYRSLGREACSKIWMENIKFFRSSQWLTNPWSCIDEICENLDNLCNPRDDISESEEECGKNSWDDIIRAIWKVEVGDFSTWQGFQRTIAEFTEKLTLDQRNNSNSLMVQQMVELDKWLGEKLDILVDLNSKYDVPRSWDHFVEIRHLLDKRNHV